MKTLIKFTGTMEDLMEYLRLEKRIERLRRTQQHYYDKVEVAEQFNYNIDVDRIYNLIEHAELIIDSLEKDIKHLNDQKNH